jgi:geranylgeranyl diphosphate synthase type I
MRNVLLAYDDKLKVIDSELAKALHDIEPDSLREATRHLLRADGKKIRPLLTLLSCEAVGGNAKDALNAAIAIELLHVASLIHDDILDGDTLRRGKRTVHSVWGTKMAIIAGDLLIGKAVEIGTRTNYLRVLTLAAQAAVEMCEGEILEIELQKNLREISEQKCLEIIKKKSASLIRVAAESGAIIGGGSEDVVKSISKHGELMGMAFQIRDDILNFVSHEDIFKKPVKTDLLAMRPNLVLFHRINCKSGNGMKIVQGMAEDFCEKAKLEIKKLELRHESKKAMEALADFACQRLY